MNKLKRIQLDQVFLIVENEPELKVMLEQVKIIQVQIDTLIPLAKQISKQLAGSNVSYLHRVDDPFWLVHRKIMRLLLQRDQMRLKIEKVAAEYGIELGLAPSVSPNKFYKLGEKLDG